MNLLNIFIGHSSVKQTISLLSLLVIFNACNPEPFTDQGIYVASLSVHGTYQLSVMQSNNPSNLNDKSQTAVNLLEELPCLYVTLIIKEDGTLETNYTDLLMSKDTEGNYVFDCGPERRSTGNWSLSANALTIDDVTYLVKDDQLIDARNRDTELIDLVVFTRI